jgi:hypothetical protein
MVLPYKSRKSGLAVLLAFVCYSYYHRKIYCALSHTVGEDTNNYMKSVLCVDIYMCMCTHTDGAKAMGEAVSACFSSHCAQLQFHTKNVEYECLSTPINFLRNLNVSWKKWFQ